MANERTYVVPSLLQTAAANACTEIERGRFDFLEVPDVDMRHCCDSLLEILKIEKNRNEGNEGQTMFIRLQLTSKDKRFLNICEEAASHGHINCLKLAHEIGVPWNDKACKRAASSGHLECLRYARENGCPWNEKTCSYAALNGHMDCLIYARENGCPGNPTRT
uniref:ACYPI009371 protein n=1 Tax=Acyrthosiphon pisum TaxID=7029 RepID=C4WW45_ACYPI|nr:ACYPI009371 [Acyrthosiphon pisum]